MGYLDAARKLIRGWVFGEVWPPPDPRPMPTFDARSRALERLAEFFSLIDFCRTGDEQHPEVTYRIPKERIFIEQPDEPERLAYPSLAFLPGRGSHEKYRLGPPPILPHTWDRWGAGTALVSLGEYSETFQIESWGSHPAERRSLLAGVEQAMRLSQESAALKLSVPQYWDSVASFLLLDSQYVDDPDIIRGRRRGQVFVELRIQEIALVDVKTMQPRLNIQVQPVGAVSSSQSFPPVRQPDGPIGMGRLPWGDGPWVK